MSKNLDLQLLESYTDIFLNNKEYITKLQCITQFYKYIYVIVCSGFILNNFE